jgi:tetratricopeptide (TPR) repeat protein
MLDLQNKFSEADKLFSSAVSLLNNGEFAAAATILVKITKEFESYGKAWYELGKIMMTQLEDVSGASDCFKKAIEVSPDYSPAYIGYAEVLFHTEKFAEMNAILNQAIELSGVRKDSTWPSHTEAPSSGVKLVR